ncbi:SagB/ThcOx family dehydrogenase [Nitratireductor sp. CAU 1489]|uniref:SagB/ThcOx family dehydrogenase n=1 Tax=Nitratireductor arenosus TaxID=2682096 RepID=A0A844QJJ0_9HYPH|nr:SagB/ThcOx family dehydrogenase [Nitratireductor arenosus]MVA98764.1 SagB/ThcOx family dehydrogenase [Nitratireductor arenosus]
MLVRPSRTLVFTHDDQTLIGCNFLSRKTFACSPDLVAVLNAWTKWQPPYALAALAEGLTEEEADDLSRQLIELSALVVEGSELAAREASFERDWSWGIPTALMHFCVQNPDYITAEEAAQRQVDKAADSTSPTLWLRNAPDQAIRLPEALDGNELFRLMARRRTVRKAGAQTITLKQLSDCLFAGLGITGETHGVTGSLPLSMTPSGGARNPYEAYIFARSVDGLAPGIYHYSALDHDLGRIEASCLPKLSELTGTQEWADEMACLIVLAADLRRTMWKYEDPNAYRVVLIEAGHIGQNIMLAATHHDLTACPTAALSHARISQLLKFDSVAVAPIYALTLARPDRAEFERTSKAMAH